MKILAVSDKVLDSHYSSNVKQKFPDIDLIIGCGDLPYYYLDFLVSALNVPMLYVHGNHDGGKQYSKELGEISTVRGGADIHGRVVQERGLIFAGLEGSMRYKPGRPYQFSDNEMTREVFRLAPALLLNRVRLGRSLDILVTHSPPLGIHDEEDRAHTGFKIFRDVIERFKPRYLLHGHVHRYDRNAPYITQYQDTTIINVYPSYVLEL